MRKIGATAVARKGTEGEARIVHRQMAHDQRVSAQYYQAVRGAQDAKKAVDTLLECVDDGEQKNTPKWSEHEVQILKDKFKMYIEWLKAPPQKLCEGIFPERKTKKVVDKVCTLIRQRERELKRAITQDIFIHYIYIL